MGYGRQYLKLLGLEAAHDEVEVGRERAVGVDGEDHGVGAEGGAEVELHVREVLLLRGEGGDSG